MFGVATHCMVHSMQYFVFLPSHVLLCDTANFTNIIDFYTVASTRRPSLRNLDIGLG